MPIKINYLNKKNKSTSNIVLFSKEQFKINDLKIPSKSEFVHRRFD